MNAWWKLKRRRREPVVASVGETPETTEALREFRRSPGRVVAMIGLALVLVALHVVLFPPSRTTPRTSLEVGTFSGQEIRAPFTFTGPRPSWELEAARREASERVEPVYRRLEGAQRRTEESLASLLRRLSARAGQDSAAVVDRREGRLEGAPGLDPAALEALMDPARLAAVGAAVEEVAREALAAGVVDVTPRGTYQAIQVVDADGQRRERRRVDSVVLGYRLEEELREELGRRLPEETATEAAVSLARELVLPNLVYDDALTQERRSAAVAAVPDRREYSRNERLLGAGVRVTRDHLAVLDALEEARLERALAQDRTFALRLRIGRVLLLTMLLGGLAYLLRHSPARILQELHRYVLLIILLALYLSLAALVLGHPGWGGPSTVPIVLLAMLATTLFGEGVGYRVSAIGLLLLAVVPEHLSPMLVAWSVAAGVTIRMVRRVRNRNQFYRAIGTVGIAYALAVTALAIGDAAGVAAALRQAALGVVSVVACTAVSLFLLPLFEALFGVTTELTLLELSDLNHPLLKRMSLESPGTFHHSQVVGTLAEAGARAIGANSLLARVGANFHDIGKMLKPRYYVENQGDNNVHDELSPSMSAIVIASHVKEGIELGRQWGLPRSVLAFIPEHHGTSVMQYFYHKALEREDGGTIKVDDFRYPGPKPQTRETAIVMLADGVEAGTRSLRRPTPSRIREMVRKQFDRKRDEGELDECGLSLSDLATVREAFVPILVGIHHHRVAYPGQREHEERKEKESLEARARSRRSGSSVATNG